MRYRVKKGHSVISQRGLCRPEEEVRPGVLMPKRIKQLLADGVLEEIPEAPKPPVEPEPQSEPEAPVVVGKWRVNPELTKDKDLDELNLMALEIDGDVAPFETIEEARAQLSEDYRPEQDA